MGTDRISTALFLAVAVLTVGGELSGIAWMTDAAAVAVVAFLILEYRRIPLLQRAVGSAFLAAGLAACAFADDPLATAERGVIRVLPFLLLFASIVWLQASSTRSPSLLALRNTVVSQPPGRRFAWVTGAGHFLGVAFNLAGLSLLTPMIAKGADPTLQKRLGRAMIQGFGAGTCWSPLYVGTAFIIASVPGVTWAQVGPLGFVVAIGLLVWGWAFDRAFARAPGRAAKATAPSPVPLGRAVGVRVAGILGALFACIVVFVEGLDWSIPIALAVTAPPFALIWAVLIRRRDPEFGPGQVARGALEILPNLRAEALLFTGATVFGVGVSALIPDAQAGGTGPIPVLPAWAWIITIMAGYALFSAMGIHPVVTVVLVTSILPAEAIGLAPEILALSLMVMWGQGTNVSPFSATVLFMARITGAGGWTVAWKWNGLFGAVTTVLLIGVLLAINASGFYSGP